MTREEEIAAGLAAVRARIDAACAAAGRERGSVSLTVVTKTFPASDAAILAGLGVREIAENRDQEARAKHAACAGLPLRWHMIGQLQRNKASHVASWADVVESVDRQPLVGALSRAAVSAGRTLTCLVQVSLDGRTDRGGALPVDVPALCDAVSAAPGLTLGGLMAVAPYPGDPGEAFARLARLRAHVLADHPAATILSAGMSGDLEEAIAHGATQVRVGGAILGSRPPVT